jgi:hypothetical protein
MDRRAQEWKVDFLTVKTHAPFTIAARNQGVAIANEISMLRSDEIAGKSKNSRFGPVFSIC